MSEKSKTEDKPVETYDPHFKPTSTPKETTTRYDPHFGTGQFDPAASRKHEA